MHSALFKQFRPMPYPRHKIPMGTGPLSGGDKYRVVRKIAIFDRNRRLYRN